MSRLIEAGPDVCTTCGCHCSGPADCQVNVDLARDGVAREVFSNPLAGGYVPPGSAELARHYEVTAAVRDRGEQTGRPGKEHLLRTGGGNPGRRCPGVDADRRRQRRPGRHR